MIQHSVKQSEDEDKNHIFKTCYIGIENDCTLVNKLYLKDLV